MVEDIVFMSSCVTGMTGRRLDGPKGREAAPRAGTGWVVGCVGVWVVGVVVCVVCGVGGGAPSRPSRRMRPPAPSTSRNSAACVQTRGGHGGHGGHVAARVWVQDPQVGGGGGS